MELLEPGLGLIIWTIISFISLALIAYAVYRLANNNSLSSREKVLWLLSIVFVPLFGAIIYLGSKRVKNTDATIGS